MTHSKEHSARGRKQRMSSAKCKAKGCNNIPIKPVGAKFPIHCSPACAEKIAMQKLENIREQQKKAENKAWKQRKEKLSQQVGRKTKQSQDPLQKECNRIARLIDKDLPCIARPFENNQHFDGGHVYSVGSHPALRYNLHNIFKQGVKSNRDLSGEQALMLEGIEAIHGPEQLEITTGLVKKYPTLKLAAHEKKAALKIARKIIREWKKKPMTRDEINEALGIYK